MQVVDPTLQIAKPFGIPVIILCDPSHQIEREGTRTLVLDKGVGKHSRGNAKQTKEQANCPQAGAVSTRK